MAYKFLSVRILGRCSVQILWTPSYKFRSIVSLSKYSVQVLLLVRGNYHKETEVASSTWTDDLGL